MTKMRVLRTLVAERLTAAAEEISRAVERMITEEKTPNTPEWSPEQRRAAVHERLSLVADEILRLLEMVMGDREAGESASHEEIERYRQLPDVASNTEANTNGADGLCRPAGEKPVSCDRSSKDASTETDSEVMHGKTSHLHRTQRADKSTSAVTETGTRVEQRGPSSDNAEAASDDDNGEKSVKANKTLRGQNERKIKRRVAPSDKVHAAGRSCCRVCGKLFRYRRSFLKHVLQHEQSSDLCGACGKRLDLGESLEAHLQTHREESICRGQTEDGRSEAEREASDSDEDWKDRDDGGEKAETGPQATRQRSTKPKGPKSKDTSSLKYRCKVCGKSFCYRASFLKHAQEDERDAGVCGVCGTHFESAESLRLHLQTYIRTEDCEVCGKRFDGRKQLEMHMRTHTGEKPYICAVCGKAFAQNGNLMGHMRVHTGERPYACSVCGQSFGFKEYMMAHMRIHTGEKPFACGVCGKGFRQRGTLKTHTMIHTGESTHRCSVCDKKFYKSGALKIHMRSHTGEKPYVCNTCGKSFTAGGSLTKHMGSHEGRRA